MPHAPQSPPRDFTLALVLSGGNALGAYQGGAYEALHERGLEPDWVVGASAGAMNGALICGNAPEQRLERLRRFWHVADDAAIGWLDPAFWWPMDEARRTQAAAVSMLAGQADWFVPRTLYGPWWNPFANPEPTSLYDSSPLEAKLAGLLDTDRLNAGAPRFSATAIDVESGEDIVFDTRTHTITPRHLRACGALMPAFSPVDVEGRLVGDGGVSANLPLDPVLGSRFDRPLLCIAVDLLPLSSRRPQSLGETILRTQDLMFATQSRRAIAAWQAVYAERVEQGDDASASLVHISYKDQGREVSGKAFDYSRRSAQERWRAGYADMACALDAIREQPAARPGLSVHALARDEAGTGTLGPVEARLMPVPA